MQVFCLSGKAQAGKDTSAIKMKEILEAEGNRVLITHYADLLKYICRQFFDWNGEKDDFGRTLLQKVGTDVVREQDPNFWVDFVAYILDLFPDEWDYVIIPDCRFPNEIDRLRNYHCLPTLHIRVVRPGFDNGLTREQKLHPSETALDDAVPEYTLMNNGGLDELYGKVYSLLESINGIHQYTIDELEKGREA